MTKFLNSKLAVTGASGNLGHRVVELLLKAGASNVVALTRDPGKIADLAGLGATVRQASFDDTASLTAAFAGIERLLIISTDSLDRRAEQQIAAIDAAEKAGIKHIAYTGVASPYPDLTALVSNSHFLTEARLIRSGVDWSFLRNNLYTDYEIPGAKQAIASGTLYHATGTGRRAFVTREDCAAAAAGALLTAQGKRIYDITGPEALSAEDMAAIYSELAGKPVKAVDVPGSAFVAGLLQAGVPQSLADVLARFHTDTAKGYLGIATDHVNELAGRPAQPFAAFMAANRAALGI